MEKRMSKGSKQRPTDKEKFDAGWDMIFGKNMANAKKNKWKKTKNGN
jgi:hypothetical protein